MEKIDSKNYLGQIVEAIIEWKIGERREGFDCAYELNYGYVQNTVSGDGEELDVYVMGVNEPVEKFTGKCIAFIKRLDDDDKLILVPEGMNFSDEEILKQTHFQERFFKPTVVR